MTCEHVWINDPMFEDGTVIMFINIEHHLGEEMRQYCELCPEIRYVTKSESQKDSTVEIK